MGEKRRRRRQHMQSDDRRRYQELTTAVARNQTDLMGYPTNPSGAAFGGITEAVSSAVSQQEGNEVTLGVLKRQVPWDTYQKADLISDRELQLIKRYDKQTRETQQRLLLEEEGVLYVNAFFSLLRSIASEEVVQYVLALL